MKQLVFFVLFFFCSITFYPFVVVVSSLVINIMEVEAISNQPVAWWFGFYWSNFIYITTTPWIKEGNMRRLIDYPPTTNLSFSSMYFSTSTSNPPTQPSTSFLFFLQFNDDSTLDDIDNSPSPYTRVTHPSFVFWYCKLLLDQLHLLFDHRSTSQ